MKKIKIILICLFAILGAYLIYSHYSTEEFKATLPNQIAQDYNLVGEIAYETKSIDEIINIVQNKYSIVFLCTPKSKWCQSYAKILNDVAIQRDVDKIYYADIAEERNLNTAKYKKLVNILSDNLRIDDAGNKRIYMPFVIFADNGKIIATDDETSYVTSEITPDEYWTEDRNRELLIKLNTYIDMLNADPIEENQTLENTTIESEEK